MQAGQAGSTIMQAGQADSSSYHAPASLDMISGPLMRKKKAPVSLATALHEGET